jgi:hypothetical protein
LAWSRQTRHGCSDSHNDRKMYGWLAVHGCTNPTPCKNEAPIQQHFCCKNATPIACSPFSLRQKKAPPQNTTRLIGGMFIVKDIMDFTTSSLLVSFAAEAQVMAFPCLACTASVDGTIDRSPRPKAVMPSTPPCTPMLDEVCARSGSAASRLF